MRAASSNDSPDRIWAPKKIQPSSLKPAPKRA